jgi:hypothetical protein
MSDHGELLAKMERVLLAVCLSAGVLGCLVPPRSTAHEPEPTQSMPSGAVLAGSLAPGSGLTRQQITDVVLSYQGAFGPCLDRAEGLPPRFEIRVSVEVVPSGEVNSAQVTTDETIPKSATTCMADVVRGWQFPSSSAPSKVSWLFHYRALENTHAP